MRKTKSSRIKALIQKIPSAKKTTKAQNYDLKMIKKKGTVDHTTQQLPQSAKFQCLALAIVWHCCS